MEIYYALLCTLRTRVDFAETINIQWCFYYEMKNPLQLSTFALYIDLLWIQYHSQVENYTYVMLHLCHQGTSQR